MSRNSTLAPTLLTIVAGWGIVATTVVVFLVYRNETDPDKRAILTMGVSLIFIWCVLGGIAMRLARDRLVRLARKLNIDWRVRFVLLCVAMAMLEEAVTTSLTNAAPLFGAVTDAARITASKNYLEVVLFHSVIAFVPMFICWGWLLHRYAFTPAEVVLLFGLNGHARRDPVVRDAESAAGRDVGVCLWPDGISARSYRPDGSQRKACASAALDIGCISSFGVCHSAGRIRCGKNTAIHLASCQQSLQAASFGHGDKCARTSKLQFAAYQGLPVEIVPVFCALSQKTNSRVSLFFPKLV
jgi:hypothetical protein